MVAGEADYLSDETDMNGLALAAEQLRKNYPKKVLMGSALPESVLVMLAQTESWRWIEDGKLQEEVLEKYLGCAERIYQAETAGVTEEEIQEEREELESAGYFSSIEMNGQVKKKYYSLSSSMVSVLIKEQRMALGYVNSASDLCWADQLGEDYVIKPITDELGIGFRPVMRLAVNSQSKQKEMAEKFVKLVLSSEFQSMNLGDGAPVNIAALEKSMEEQTGFNRALYGTDADGNSVSVYALWPSKETLEVYIDSIEKMNHSLGYNQFLADAVGKIGKKMLEEGNISKGDAVNEIRKKAAIFLAE